MLRLAQKASIRERSLFLCCTWTPVYKFPEMIEFRDSYPRQIGAELIVHKNQEALDSGANPYLLGTQKCCGLLKTKSLLDALAEGGFDAAFGGARRDEEKSAPRNVSIRSAIPWASGTQKSAARFGISFPRQWNVEYYASADRAPVGAYIHDA